MPVSLRDAIFDYLKSHDTRNYAALWIDEDEFNDALSVQLGARSSIIEPDLARNGILEFYVDPDKVFPHKGDHANVLRAAAAAWRQSAHTINRRDDAQLDALRTHERALAAIIAVSVDLSGTLVAMEEVITERMDLCHHRTAIKLHLDDSAEKCGTNFGIC